MQPDASTPLIECRQVSRSFDVSTGFLQPKFKLQAVRDVSLRAERGKMLAIVGESGCGKTTLSRLMLGLLAPTAGQLLIDGQPIGSVSQKDIARKVQPVFQDPYSSLNPRKTIGTIIGFPLQVHGIGDAQSRAERVARVMEMVDLPRRLVHSYPSQLSGGQRQRVAIARALAIEPQALICDEPTSALDVSVQANILNLLQDLRERLSLTFVFISHNLAVVRHLADSVAVMYLGRVVEQGETDRIFASPQHPYTRALLASALTPDPDLGLPAVALEGAVPNPLSPPSGCAFNPRCPHRMPHCAIDDPALRLREQRWVACHLTEANN